MYKGKNLNTFPLATLHQTSILHSSLMCLLPLPQQLRGKDTDGLQSVQNNGSQIFLCWVSKAGKWVRWITLCSSTLKVLSDPLIMGYSSNTLPYTHCVSDCLCIMKPLCFIVSNNTM